MTVVNKMIIALQMELQVSYQYMIQHIFWDSLDAFIINDDLKRKAIEEMSHFEQIADRIMDLDKSFSPQLLFEATSKSINIGITLDQMIRNDIEAESNTIILYKEIIEDSKSEKDYATQVLFMNLLKVEESHKSDFEGFLSMSEKIGGKRIAKKIKK